MKLEDIKEEDWLWAQSALSFQEVITKHSARAEKEKKND